MEIFVETERLLLRRFTEDDVDDLVELDGDPEVMHFVTGGRPTSRAEIEDEVLPAFLEYYARFDGYGFWAAIEKPTGRFVGWFHFRPAADARPNEVELGYRLRTSAWGNGFATEGSRALIDKGFAELGVERVVASTMAVHVASRRVLEKAGLRYVRTFHQPWPDHIEGEEEGDVEYALLRSEWEEQARARPAAVPSAREYPAGMTAAGPLPGERGAVRPLDVAHAPEPGRDDGLEALLGRIVAEIRAGTPPRGMSTRIVAIDGLGGSGKSSLAEHLSRALDSAPIVHTDDFASWDDPVDWWPRLIEHVLEPVSRHEVVRFERSRWDPEQDRGSVEIPPTPFLIVEGVTASREAFAPYLAYAIWVEAPPELRLRRGFDRDGQDALGQWQAWMAEEELYRARERPDERADTVVRGDADLWS